MLKRCIEILFFCMFALTETSKSILSYLLSVNKDIYLESSFTGLFIINLPSLDLSFNFPGLSAAIKFWENNLWGNLGA